MARKTIAIADLLETANKYLALDEDGEFVTTQWKCGVIDLLVHALEKTGQYAGFGYIEPYDANDPEFKPRGRKDAQRQYYLAKR